MSLKRIITTPSQSFGARLLKPSKESNWRWTAEAAGRSALGDTVEEACDNLRDLLVRRR